jgi:hypothetical protein
MKLRGLLALASLLCLAIGPAFAGDGTTGFWITLWPPATSASVILLCGVFCALWAQNTGRNPWQWFVLGAVFNVITLAVLLYQNAEDLKARSPGRSPPN